MSSDLLKEFGSSNNEAIEDDFGDFEDPSSLEGHGTEVTPNAWSVAIGKTSEEFATLSGEDFDEPGDFEDTVLGTHLDPGQQAKNSEEAREDEWGAFEDGPVLFDIETEPKVKKIVPKRLGVKPISTPRPVDIEDDDFDSWDSIDSTNETVTAAVLTPQPFQSATKHGPRVEPSGSLASGPPPSNVPPPSILLALGTTVIEDLSHLRKQDASSEQLPVRSRQGLSDLRAIGRLLAGRKARWKRDNLLSQGMRIGESGKPGGMKLTRVDKTEDRREEQEAEELLATWKFHAGPLRAALVTAGDLKFTELSESMPIRTEKGALIAPKPCFLCGLKRDERVMKVDHVVEDSFGEWWVEHWGHLDCVKLWDGHKRSLPQR